MFISRFFAGLEYNTAKEFLQIIFLIFFKYFQALLQNDFLFIFLSETAVEMILIETPSKQAYQPVDDRFNVSQSDAVI